MTTYTPEQISIAKAYEAKAFQYITDDPEKFDEVMAEFDEVKAGWDN